MTSVNDMSRSERRAKQVVESQPMWAQETLSGYGIAPVPGSATRWFTYKCSTDGNVRVLTPLYEGKLRGESKDKAAVKLMMALRRFMGGVSND